MKKFLILFTISLCIYPFIFSQQAQVPSGLDGIFVNKVEGLIKVFTPAKEEILISSQDKPRFIPTGSRIKVLLRNAEITIDKATITLEQKSTIQLWSDEKTRKIDILVDEQTAGKVTLKLENKNYILDAKDRINILFNSDFKNAVITAVSGNINISDEKGTRILSQGKKEEQNITSFVRKVIEAEKPAVKKEEPKKEVKKAEPVKPVEKKVEEIKKEKVSIEKPQIKITKVTGKINLIKPDKQVLTILSEDELPESISENSIIQVVKGTAIVKAGKIIATIEEKGVLQIKYNSSTGEYGFVALKQSKGGIIITAGENKVYLSAENVISIKYDSKTLTYVINVVKGDVKIAKETGETIIVKEGTSYTTEITIIVEKVLPEPFQPPLEEASPSSF